MWWKSYQATRIIILAAILLVLTLRPLPVFAHERVELGDYSVVVGWREEPAIVGERNALLLLISEGDTPLQGAEATLDAELMYGGQTFRANLTPSLTPGEYTAEIFPTVRGQYEVRLFGTLGTETVDVTIAPEEIFPASRIQFPVAQPDIVELEETLQTEIATLQTQLQTLQWVAFTSIGIGILGMGVALVALRNRQ